MRLVRITEPQASFLEIEIVGRYAEDEFDLDAVAAIVDEHLVLSRGTKMAVPNKLLVEMLLDAANDIDDAIEEAFKRRELVKKLGMEMSSDSGALGHIGVETIGEARRLHCTAIALLNKARRALSPRTLG